MKIVSALLFCLLGLALDSAVAAPPHDGPDRPGIVRARQSGGTPTRASSFAPHSVSTRVFGAPIQAPILFSAHHPNNNNSSSNHTH